MLEQRPNVTALTMKCNGVTRHLTFTIWFAGPVHSLFHTYVRVHMYIGVIFMFNWCVFHLPFASQAGWTPLIKAACYGYVEIAQQLIQAGAKINQALPVRCLAGVMINTKMINVTSSL